MQVLARVLRRVRSRLIAATSGSDSLRDRWLRAAEQDSSQDLRRELRRHGVLPETVVVTMESLGMAASSLKMRVGDPLDQWLR